MRITEQQIRDIVKETLNEINRRSANNNTYRNGLQEGFRGLSLDNFVKNGHFHESSKSRNPVIQTAWRNGWELTKADGNENAIEGEYDAKIMNGVFNNYRPDKDPSNKKHPKVSWPMLVAILNKQFRATGYRAMASNYRESYEDLMGREDTEGGAGMIYGTITIVKTR